MCIYLFINGLFKKHIIQHTTYLQNYNIQSTDNIYQQYINIIVQLKKLSYTKLIIIDIDTLNDNIYIKINIYYKAPFHKHFVQNYVLRHTHTHTHTHIHAPATLWGYLLCVCVVGVIVRIIRHCEG